MKQFLRIFFLFLFVSLYHAFNNHGFAQLQVQTGKSYINISKPAGGVIENGNELEIRAVISVTGGNAYFVRYNDTIPAGTTYKANSIRLSTNEGLVYGTPLRPTGLLTDAASDDEARFSAGILRVNLGSLTKSGGQTAAYNAVAAPNVIDVLPAASGCTIFSNGRPSFYGSTVIIMVTYRVIVTATSGNTFFISGGAFRYKTANTFSETTLPSQVRRLNSMTVMVSDPLPVCNSIGANSITGVGSNFGTGSTQNLSPAPLPGTVVPGYFWQPFTSGTGPNDSSFTVANNTSTNGSTNSFLPYPSSPSRLFGVWDIIGDHTNASNPLLGNPPTTPGQTGGYMAVVNAAYGINNAVQQTVNGLCPDTYYEFSAWFRNICRRCSCDSSGKGSGTANFKSYMAPSIPNTNDSAGVLPNLTFQIGGVDYYTTGNLDYNGQWVKKGFLLKTGPAQTSVNIVIRNNAPGGGGNDWVMDDVAFATCLPDLGMQPTNNPLYCTNAEVKMSVIVNSFYNNYQYYQWERSTDGGITWSNAPLAPTPQTFSYNYQSPDYIDTVSYPVFLASPSNTGHKFRIRVATNLTNLSNNNCSIYNSNDIITIGSVPFCNILPNSLTAFKATLSNKSAHLQWQGTLQQNNSSFIIERSKDGVHFYEAGIVTGAGQGSFSWNDPVAVNDKTYYRIKLVTGTDIRYSETVVLGFLSDLFELKSVSNPFRENIRAEIISGNSRWSVIQLLDLSGRLIREEKIKLAAGVNTITLQYPYALQPGMYMIKISSEEKAIQKLIMKMQ